MKTKRLIPILCLPALLTPAFAIKPKTDTTNPHGVLIGKDGSVIKNGFIIDLEDDLLNKAIYE